MASCNIVQGAELQIQWPQTQNIVSLSSTEEIFEQLELNQLVSVTEKLDGCNVSISSKGWIASRRRILVENIEQADLNKVKLNRIKLTSLFQDWSKLKELKEELDHILDFCNFELIIFGELITEGTATTYEDRFCYDLRDIKTGQLYVFGIAFKFGELTQQEQENFKAKTENQLRWNLVHTCEESKFFVFGFNSDLHVFLRERLFKTVPYIGDDFFNAVLSNQALAEKLKNREVEGFILTGPNLILKWKFFEKGQKSSQKLAIEALKTRINEESLIDVVKTLEEVSLSEAPEGREFKPLKKPSQSLFGQIIRSALTKLPSPADSENTIVKTENQIVDACSNFKDALEAETLGDFLEAGFKVDSDDHKVLKAKIESLCVGISNKLLAKRRKKEFSRLKVTFQDDV